MQSTLEYQGATALLLLESSIVVCRLQPECDMGLGMVSGFVAFYRVQMVNERFVPLILMG